MDSRGSLEVEEWITPSLKTIRFCTDRRSMWSVPVFRPVDIHCRISGRSIVRRLPVRLMGRESRGGAQPRSHETSQKR